MKKILISFALLLLAMTTAFAQMPKGAALKIGRLYGKVVETAGKPPIAYASVTVLKNVGGRDSLVGGALTEENGDFNITGLPMGPLTVKVSFVGYTDFTKIVKIMPPDNVEQDLGNIKLAADAKVLGEVEIKAEKVSTQISLEKKVYNVEKNITATGGTAEDVLKSVPSVSVDVDGNPKLRDRATTIYVDGKPTLMSLTQIPSDQIESVEVISNPSAKYEASTTGGILNIVLKKNRKPGYNGMLGLGVGNQGRYNGMLNLNAHEGKFNVTGFYNVNSSKNPSVGYVNLINKNLANGSVINYFNQNTGVTFENLFQIGRIGVDYAVNNRNTLSLTGTMVAGKFNIDVDQSYQFTSPTNEKLSYGTRQLSPQNDFKNKNIEAAWKKTFAKKDESLSVLANYSQGSFSNVADWTTTGYDKTGQLLANNPELVKINGGNTNQQAVFQVDFVNPINDSSKLEMGVRSFWSGKDQNYFFNEYSYDKKTYIANDTLSQDFRITENINAAYLTYSSRLKYQINYQIGLRFEQSSLTGTSHLATVSDFGYNYPKGTSKDLMRSFFPALYLSKKIDAKTEIGLNFSRKIQRPNFRQLMPGVQASDKQNLQIGNPNLQPEFINLAEFSYNKIFGSNNWISTLYLANETNTLKPLTYASADDPSVKITKFVNGTNELMYGLDNTLKLSFGKNLELMLNANVFDFTVNVDTFHNTGWTWTSKANLTYKFPASISMQINGGYDADRPAAQGIRKGAAYADFAVKKSFFNNAANVTFSVNDVFNSRKDISILDQPSYYQETMRRRDTRYYKLSLQIPFGKVDASMFKKMKDAKKQGGQQEQPDFGG
jgi:hypothetical protein